MPAPADPNPKKADEARLSALLKDGAVAASAKRWNACIEALTAALAMEDAAKTAGDLGLCEEQTGRFASAYTHLARAMEAAPTTQPIKEPWKRYQDAQARVFDRVAVLVISTHPPNARVVLDGRPLGPAGGRAFAVDPGTHTIAARLEGYSDEVEIRTMRARDMPKIHLHLKPKPQAKASGASAAAGSASSAQGVAPVPPRDSPFRWYLPAGSPRGVLVGATWAATATAVASGATWIGLEVDRASIRAKLDRSSCSPVLLSRPAECDAAAERHQQRDMAAAVTIGAAIGAVVLGAASGVAIGLERRSTVTAIGPLVTHHGGGIAVGGVW